MHLSRRMIWVAAGLVAVGGTVGALFTVPRVLRADEDASFLRAAALLSASDTWERGGSQTGALTLDQQRALLADSSVKQALELAHNAAKRPLKPSVTPARAPVDAGAVRLGEVLFEFPALRGLGKALTAEQRVAFADGRHAEALESLRVGVRLALETEQADTLHALVGFAIHDLVRREAVSHLQDLDADGCLRLSDICREELANPSPLPQLVEIERAQAKANARTFLTEARKPDTKVDDLLFGEARGNPAVRADVERARRNPAAAEVLLQKTDAAIDAFADRCADEARKPHWARATLEPPAIDSFASWWVRMQFQALPELPWAFAREEAYARLLALEALIQRYELQHGTPPASLADLHAGDLTIDPFSGQPLKYELRGGTYTLSSIGRETNADDPQAVDGRRPITLGR